MHIVILGNGIVALSIAFRLAQRTTAADKITVIGKSARTGSATVAAAAMLNSFAEIEAGSLESDLDKYRFELSRKATSMWPAFEAAITVAASSDEAGPRAQGFQGGKPFEFGTYVVNNTAADDLDDQNFDAIVEALKQFDEPFDHVSPHDIPNYMPEQRHRATRAIYIRQEGWMNPCSVLEKLDEALANFPQVKIVDANADRLVKSRDAIDAVVLDNGQVISGDKFVLATGATMTALLEKSDLGINVQRVFYGVGVSIEIKSSDFPHQKCIRTPNRGLACGLYTAPYFTHEGEGDHVLIGASNFISPTPYHHGRLTSVYSLMESAIEQINFNFYRADLIKVNIGWRPTSQDTFPLLGKTSLGNLIIAGGTKRDGFHLSPLISEKIVTLLFDEPIEKEFSWFAPERKPIRSMTREQAISKAVQHQMSASYQHGFSPSKSRMPEQITQMYRDNIEKLHDQVGAIDWGIPPEMLDMYRYGHAVA